VNTLSGLQASAERDARSATIDRLRREMDERQRQSNTIERKHIALQEKRSSAMLELHSRQQLEKQLELGVEKEKRLALELEQLRAQIPELDARLAAKQTEREQQKRERNAVETSKYTELQRLERDADELRKALARVLQYEAEKKAKHHVEHKEKIVAHEAKVQSLSSTAEGLSDKHKQLMKLCSEVGDNARALADELEVRKLERLIKEGNARIDTLQKQLTEIPGGAHLHSKLSAEREKLRATASQRDHLAGQVSAIDEGIRQRKAELNDAKYRDIDATFKQKQIELKTTAMACADLEKYYQALDAALMRFHSIKMGEINKIVKEYWQQTYQVYKQANTPQQRANEWCRGPHVHRSNAATLATSRA
jgi:DNA repair protein RAD50